MFRRLGKRALLILGEKWGSIDSEWYCQKIVPLIHGMASMQPWLSVMRDNGPLHSAAKTMGERAITPISWPPGSPDLNPIEAVWDSMKDYIQFNYPSLGGEKKTISRKIPTGLEGSMRLCAL